MLIWGGCAKKHKDYSYLLKLYPKNRTELIKLVEFYRQENNPETIEFTDYLLETLPYQYTLRYTVNNQNQGRRILNTPISPDSVDILRHTPGNSLRIDTVFTINEASSGYLIGQINYAVSLRKNFRWARDITKEQFCSYILPYQINNEEHFDYKTFYGRRYLPYINDVLIKNLDTNAVLGNYIPPFFETLTNPLSSHVDFTSVLKIKELKDCADNCADIEDIKVLETHALRAIGVPCTYEYTPYLAPFMHGDVIVHIFDTNKKTHFAKQSRDLYKFRVAKFYRNVFDLRLARNPFRELLDMGVEFNDIPLSLNIPKSIDITNEKTLTTKIKIDVPDSLLTNKVLYLATGFNNNWKIVSWAKTNTLTKSIEFKDMGIGMTYILSKYKNGKATFPGTPFIITAEGKTIRLDLSGPRTNFN